MPLMNFANDNPISTGNANNGQGLYPIQSLFAAANQMSRGFPLIPITHYPPTTSTTTTTITDIYPQNQNTASSFPRIQ